MIGCSFLSWCGYPSHHGTTCSFPRNVHTCSPSCFLVTQIWVSWVSWLWFILIYLDSSCRSFARRWCLSLMAAGLKLSTKLVQVVRSRASQKQTSKMHLGCSAMQTDFDCSCIIWWYLDIFGAFCSWTMFQPCFTKEKQEIMQKWWSDWEGLKTSIKSLWF